MLIGLVMGLAAAALLVRRKGGMVVASLLAAALSLGVVLLAEGTYGSAARSNVIVDRILTIGNVGNLVKSDSLYDRFYENELAIQALKESPLSGIGWGASYGAKVAEPQPDGTFEIKDRQFIHNQYLSLWMRTGLAGVAAFVFALGASLVYGASWARRRAWDDQSWLGAAVVASTVAIAMSSLVEIYLLNPNSIVVISIVLALASVLRRELRRTAPAPEEIALRASARELRSALAPH
jgi:O-antigen ligase